VIESSEEKVKGKNFAAGRMGSQSGHPGVAGAQPASRQPQPAGPPREYQITLFASDGSPDRDGGGGGEPGFGLRVVGAPAADLLPSHARVLWTRPGGAADRCGIKVGDKVCINNLRSLL